MSKKPAGASGKGRPKPATTWVTPGASKKPAWGSKPAAKKKTGGGGGVFAAMMAMDSDSD